MTMYFEISGIETSPFVPPIVAFFISFFTSMGGVSGAFLLLPFQVSVLGYTAPSVSATNHFFNAVAIPSGVYRYIKDGRIVWPLALIVILGTLPGVLLGALVRVRYLPDSSHFKLFAATVLLYIGGRIAYMLLRQRHKLKMMSDAKTSNTDFSTKIIVFSICRLEYDFNGKVYRVSVPTIFSVCLIVGIVGGIYGIGGGAFVAPILVSVFRLPVHTVAGAALSGTLTASATGVVFYQVIAPLYPSLSVAPDWKLGLLFGIGGAAGMYLGAKYQRYFPAAWLQCMLTVIILFVSLRYFFDFVF